MYKYPAMTKTMTGSETPGTPPQTFLLHVEKGQFTDSEIVVMLGECAVVFFILFFDFVEGLFD
jgi:translation initiation factor RLI1